MIPHAIGPGEQLEEITGLMPFLTSGLFDVHWRSDDHLVQMPHSDWLFGQKEKADGVSQQFFFLRQPKFLFVRARLCAFLDGGDVDQKRNEILNKIEAGGLGLIIEEIESKIAVSAEE